MADSAYLQEHVGAALTAGLASVAAAQPNDPVDYLAHWLLKYLAVEEQKTAASAAEMLIKKEQEDMDKTEQAVEDKKSALILQVDQYKSDIASSFTIEAMHDVLIKALRETTAASNAYIAILEPRTPPEGQTEAEEEAYVPPEVPEGEEAPPAPKTLPLVPKFSALKYVRANEANSFLVGTELVSPALGPPSMSFKAVEARAGMMHKSVMEADPPAIFHDMPMPGSFASAAMLTSETDTHLAGGVLGLVCVDTVAPTGGVFKEQDEMVLKMLTETAAKTQERLVVEERGRIVEEDAVLTKLFAEDIVTPEDQVAGDGDDVATLEAKVDAAASTRFAAVRALLSEKIPAEKVGHHGHTMQEILNLGAEHPTSRVAAAAEALVGCTPDETSELCSLLAGLDIKVINETMVQEARARLLPEGATPITHETEGLTFAGKLLLAFVTLALEIAAPALRLQMMRRAEEEAKLAELEAEKAAKQAELDAAAGAAAEEAPPPAE